MRVIRSSTSETVHEIDYTLESDSLTWHVAPRMQNKQILQFKNVAVTRDSAKGNLVIQRLKNSRGQNDGRLMTKRKPPQHHYSNIFEEALLAQMTKRSTIRKSNPSIFPDLCQ
jgi:hypothetical protein